MARDTYAVPKRYFDSADKAPRRVYQELIGSSFDTKEEAQDFARACTKHLSKEEVQFLHDRTVELAEHILNQNIGIVVFLDRSARPLADLLSTYLRQRGISRGIIIKFLNIGKSQIRDSELTSKSARISGQRLDEVVSQMESTKEFKQLSDQYVSDYAKSGENILIVDEFSPTGDSVKVAQRVVRDLCHCPGDAVQTFEFVDREVEGGSNQEWLQWARLRHQIKGHFPVYDVHLIPEEDEVPGSFKEDTPEDVSAITTDSLKQRNAYLEQAAGSAEDEQRRGDIVQLQKKFKAEHQYDTVFYHDYISGLKKRVFSVDVKK